VKLTCLQENLRRGLAVVSHAVAGKSTMPVLANVLLATDGDRLKLVGTNLEIAITHWIGATIAEGGHVTVPAKLLSDVVNNLPDGPLTLTLDPRIQTLKIEAARFVANIKGIEGDEFPAIPSFTGQEKTLELPPEELRAALSQIVFAAADDDKRPVLQGVLVRLDAHALMLQAADGFRAAVLSVPLEEPTAQPREFVVPAQALEELQRLVVSDDPVIFTVTAGEILFHHGATELVSRLIDSKFPDVQNILPRQYLTRTVVNTAEAVKAVKLAALLAAQNVLKLTMEPGAGSSPGKLIFSSWAAEVGDYAGEIDAIVTGEAGTIALNVKYLLDLLGSIKTEQFAIETQTAQSAGVFRLVGTDAYSHVIMPMSIPS
jgi:DNA polymerase-3 subunit beta